jgi:hypothetical protein
MSSSRLLVGRRSTRRVALRGYGMSFARWRQRFWELARNQELSLD